MSTCPYDRPTPGAYTSKPAPGAVALMHVILDSPRWPAATNLGIVRDKDRCGADDTTSRHCWSPHGAAAGDNGFPLCHDDGDDLFETLIAAHEALGVQGINWCGDRYGFGDCTLRPIPNGQNQHDDHVHWELTDAAARDLTYERAWTILHPSDEPDPPDEPEDDVQLLVRGRDMNAVWITNGIERRHVGSGDDLDVARVLCRGQGEPLEMDPAALAHIPIVGATNANSLPAYDPTL